MSQGMWEKRANLYRAALFVLAEKMVGVEGHTVKHDSPEVSKVVGEALSKASIDGIPESMEHINGDELLLSYICPACGKRGQAQLGTLNSANEAHFAGRGE